jgi:enamine deaminase RidA (YjgF/YER057c/UK114 family)
MRKRVEANRPWAKVMGYSRAVRVGNVVEVSGTAAAAPDGSVLSPGDVEG